MVKRLIAAAVAASIVVTPVQAACWRSEEASAAAVRTLQSMLMVATLRCQVAKFDITGDYNAFIKANRIALQRMNDLLKAHFTRSAGRGGQTAYDRFATTLANGFGAAASGAEICAGAASVAREAAKAGSVEGLLMLANREGLAPALPDGACPPSITIARAGGPTVARK